MIGWRSSVRETIPPILDRNAELRPDKVCTHFEEGPVTFAEMHERSTSVANSLLQLGIGPGDTVATLMENSAEVLYVWFAVSKIGAVIVPINTQYLGEYLRHQLATAEASVVVVDQSLADRVRRIASQLPELRHVVVRMETDGARTTLDGFGAGINHHRVADLLTVDSDRLLVSGSPKWDQPNAIFYTAGTTGPSKGVVMTQNYIVRTAKLFFEHLRDGREDDVVYSPLPLFHFNAILVSVMGPMAVGATGALDRRFSVSRFWDRARHYDATQISILGSMIVMLWNRPHQDDDHKNSVRVMIGAPVPADIHRRFERRFGLKIVTVYGVSEACSMFLSPLSDPAPPGYAGKPSPLFDVRLFDDDEQEVPVGEVGEVVCRPLEPHVMFEGYYNNPAATVTAWRNLWFHTGDLGRMTSEGYFAFVDRKKDYMRRRGENISSFELDAVLMLHPAVAEVATHAVESEFSEDDVKACIVVKPGSTLEPAELMDHCIENVPSFAVPRYIEFFDELPKNPVGRILKYKLRELGVTPQTWDRVAAGYEVISR